MDKILDLIKRLMEIKDPMLLSLLILFFTVLILGSIILVYLYKKPKESVSNKESFEVNKNNLPQIQTNPNISVSANPTQHISPIINFAQNPITENVAQNRVDILYIKDSIDILKKETFELLSKINKCNFDGIIKQITEKMGNVEQDLRKMNKDVEDIKIQASDIDADIKAICGILEVFQDRMSEVVQDSILTDEKLDEIAENLDKLIRNNRLEESDKETKEIEGLIKQIKGRGRGRK